MDTRDKMLLLVADSKGTLGKCVGLLIIGIIMYLF